MKPCRNFKQRIALSIVEGENDAAVQEHLRQCAACRAYADELRAVCSEHTECAAHLPQADAPLRLHGKITAALRHTEQRWSWARPIAAGALAALVIGLYLQWRPSTKQPVVVTAPPPQRQFTEPSYAAYRNHLSRSVEELDLALSRYDVATTAADELLRVSSRPGELQ